MGRWAVGLAVVVVLVGVGRAAGSVNIDMVTVGNPGNAGEQSRLADYGDPTYYGGVAYVYSIGKHEVTNEQYGTFLNDVAKTDTYSLYDTHIESTIPVRNGIIRTGSPGSYSYAVKPGREDNPVVSVSWYSAIRYCNWLTSSQTESGTYTITGTGPNWTVSIPDHATLTSGYFLPTDDEWYKAAYYDPWKPGGAGYWDYPTRTDDSPYSDQPPGNDAPDKSNTANFYKDDSLPNGYDDGFAVPGSPSKDNLTNYLTDVGSYTLASSAYGTFDQGGNVREWNETTYKPPSRGLRGGSWGEEG